MQNTKSLEDLKLDLIEIQACRENQYYKDKEYFLNNFIQSFDDTEICNLGSEDAYYEMQEQYLIAAINNYEYNNYQPKKKYKQRLNKYNRKKITQQKLRNLKGICCWYVVGEAKEGYLYRCYVSKRSKRSSISRAKFYKRLSNHMVRHNQDFKLKGNNYRKVFDYWWEVD